MGYHHHDPSRLIFNMHVLEYLSDAAQESASQSCNFTLACNNFLSDINIFAIPSTAKNVTIQRHMHGNMF